MKSLLQNNLMNTGLGENTGPASIDAGIFNRAPGNKGTGAKPEASFNDIFMQAVSDDHKQTAVKQPDAPTAAMPKAKMSSDQLERDLVDRRGSTPVNTSSDRKPIEDDDDEDASPLDRASADRANAKPTKTAHTQQAAKIERPDAPDTRIDATKKPESVSNELRPLKLAVGTKASSETMVGNNAVLSFITGRLDRLDPAGIPSIISDSMFLKQAVSVGEINDLMMQPMSLSDLCKLFEIDQSVLNKAVANGLNPSAMASPKDFLNALGIDSGRVTTELSLLQQKLPIEGVQSYVERAKAMANRLANKVPGSLEGIPVEVAGDPTSMAALRSGENGDLTLSPSERESGSMPNMVPPGMGAHMVSPGQMQNPGTAQLKDPTVQSPGQVTKPGLGAIAKPNPSGMNKFSGGDSLFDALISNRIDAPKSPISNVDAKIETEEMTVDFAAATRDPFAQMGLDMRPFDVASATYAPTNMGASMSSMEEQLAANGFALKATEMVVDDSALASDKKSLFSDEGFDTKDLKDRPEGLFEMRDLFTNNQTNNLQQDATPMIQNAFSGGGSFSGEGMFDQESSSRDSESGNFSTSILNSTSQNSSGVKTGTFVTNLEGSSTPTAPSPSNIHSKIMQNASMLLKDGGGSMRMDVEAPGMGKIDLAINLNNNQLDVRILTPNEQVRDIINKELSGLRDGLGQQGISLRTIEVGNMSQTSQQFAGGNFAQGRQGQQASYNEMKEYAQNFANSFTPRESAVSRLDVQDVRRQVPSAWMNTARDHSKIAVRI